MGIVIGQAGEEDAAPPRSSGQGVSVRRSGESLETVHTKISAFSLLNGSAQSELMHIDLHTGGRLTLTPDPTIIETFYVVWGELEGDLSIAEARVLPGDSFSTAGLSEPVLLVARTASRLLYHSDTPLFHTLSEDLGALRELAVEVELKDGYTADHCLRLQDLAYAAAHELGLPPARLRLLDYGAFLHDVGKLYVPLSILNKPGRLTPEEWTVIKKHPTYGRELLAPTFLRDAGGIVEQHHERLDGSGYPFGLAKDDVLIESYIVAVADTFDAMTTDRPYARARTEEEALAELERLAGIHYPEEVIRAFRAGLRRFKAESGP